MRALKLTENFVEVFEIIQQNKKEFEGLDIHSIYDIVNCNEQFEIVVFVGLYNSLDGFYIYDPEEAAKLPEVEYYAKRGISAIHESNIDFAFEVINEVDAYFEVVCDD